jgi:hypothetical protein
VHICNPAFERLRQEDCELQSSLGYWARPCLKEKKKKKKGQTKGCFNPLWEGIISSNIRHLMHIC